MNVVQIPVIASNSIVRHEVLTKRSKMFTTRISHEQRRTIENIFFSPRANYIFIRQNRLTRYKAILARLLGDEVEQSRAKGHAEITRVAVEALRTIYRLSFRIPAALHKNDASRYARVTRLAPRITVNCRYVCHCRCK